jgi:autotransporter-associated beta strand protein
LATTTPAANAQTFTWTGAGTSGGWNQDANWENNVKPTPAGGAAGLSLVFRHGLLALLGRNATNDITPAGTPFLLSSLVLETQGLNERTQPDLIIGGSAPLRFVNDGSGGGPVVRLVGHGTTAVSSNIELANSLTFSGAGGGTLLLSGVVSGANSLNVALTGAGRVELRGTNTFTGGVTLRSGTLVAVAPAFGGNSAALGTGTLTVEAPAAAGARAPHLVLTNNPTVANAVHLNGTLTVGDSLPARFAGYLTSSAASATLSGPISGGGGLTVANGQRLNITGTANFTGALILEGGYAPAASDATTAISSTDAYGVSLSGSGAVTSASRITVGNSATLSLLLDTAAFDRVGDAIPIFLNGGRLSYRSNTTGAAGEAFGALTISGGATLALRGATAVNSSTLLTFASLTQQDRGTLFIRNAGAVTANAIVGGGVPGPGRINITVGGGLSTVSHPNAPVAGGQYTGIIPYIAGQQPTGGAIMTRPPELSVVGLAELNAATHLATYDTNGLRLIALTDPTYFAQVTSGPGGQKNLLAYANNTLRDPASLYKTFSVNGTVAVNALGWDNGGRLNGAYTLAGATANQPDAHTLAINSGALVNAGGAGSVLTVSDLTLDFGSRTGYFWGGQNFITAAGQFRIRGTGGVAVSGTGNTLSSPATPASVPTGATLDLSGGLSNPFTGGLFINSGARVLFSADNQLGAAGQPITLGGGTLVGVGATATVASGRPFTVGAAGGYLATKGSTLPGAVATLTIDALLSGNGVLNVVGPGDVRLTALNAPYGGEMRVGAGTLTLSGSWLPGSGASVTVFPGATLLAAKGSNLPGGVATLAGGVFRPIAATLAPGEAPVNLLVRDERIPSGLGLATGNGDTRLGRPVTSGLLVGTGMSARIGTITGTGGLVKGGTGAVAVNSVNIGGVLDIQAGSFTLIGDAGDLSAGLARVDAGGALVLDYRATSAFAAANIPIEVAGGGELRLLGSNFPTFTHSVNGLSGVVPAGAVGPAAGRPGALGGGTLTLVRDSFGSAFRVSTTDGDPLLYRGNGLGTVTGARVLFTNAGATISGDASNSFVVRGGRADDTETGVGKSLAFYDATNGVRVGRPTDYLTSPALLTIFSPGPVTTQSNVRIPTGGTTVARAFAHVNSLTLAPGSNVTFEGDNASLAFLSGTVFVEGGPGGPAVVSGAATGTFGVTPSLTTNLGPTYLVTVGDLHLNAALGTSGPLFFQSGDFFTGLSGAPEVVKLGQGTLRLGAATTARGNLIIQEGTVRVEAASALPGVGAITQAFPFSNTVTYGGVATVADGATLSLGAYAQSLRALDFQAGATLNLDAVPGGAPTLTLSPRNFGQTYNYGKYGYPFSDGILRLDGTITGTGSLLIAPQRQTFDPATTVVLSGANTFSGGLTLGGSEDIGLLVRSTTALGTGALALANGGAAYITFSGLGKATVANDILLSTVAPTSTAVPSVTFTTDAGVNDYSAYPDDAAAAGPFARYGGVGELTLSGRISGGTATQQVSFGGVLDPAGIRLTNTTNDFKGIVQIGSVTASDARVFGDAGNRLELIGTLRLDGPMTLDREVRVANVARPTLEVNTFAVTLSGLLTNSVSTADLIKTGGGKLTISNAANTYGGATFVDAGILSLTGAIGMANSGETLTVNAGAVLEGTGTVRGGSSTVAALTVNPYGTLAPGVAGVNNGIGTLTADSLLWNGGGVFRWDLSSAASDKIQLAGFFNRGATGGEPFLFVFRDANITGGFVPGAYTLATYASTNFTAGDLTYTGLPGELQGAFTVNGSSLIFTISSSTIPEPSSLALAAAACGSAIGMVFLTGFRRKRRTHAENR